MADVNVVLQTQNQMIVNYDVSKIFVWNPTTQTGTYTNSTGAAVDLFPGRVMARIAATGKLVPLNSAGNDGSQYPVGIINQGKTVANGVTTTLTIVVGGDVARDKVILSGSDTLATVIEGRTIADRIMADTMGINLVMSDENTRLDNQ